jgi:hypothetical protein
MAADKNAQKGNTGGTGASGSATGAGQQISGEQIFATTEQNTASGEAFGTTGGGGTQGAGQGKQGSETGEQLANQVGEVLRGNTTGVADTARDLYSQAKESTGQVASQTLGQVTDKASTAIDQGKATLAQGLTTVVESIRSMGEQLRTADQGGVVAFTANYGDMLANQVENIAGYLEGRDTRQLVSDVQRFARRNPAVFVGSAFALGLLAARFLKSSPRQELMVRPENSDTATTGLGKGRAGRRASGTTSEATTTTSESRLDTSEGIHPV